MNQIFAARTPADAATVSAAQKRGAYDPSDGLTLSEAGVLCLVMNPSLRTSRLKARIPLAGAKEAGRWDDPELGADILRILDDVDNPWLVGASLSFTLPISGRLEAEKAKATAEGRATLASVYALEQEKLLELRESWSDWRQVHQAADASQKCLKQLDAIAVFAQRQEALGEMLPTEAGVFHLARAREQTALARREAEGREARLKILALLGLSPKAAVALIVESDFPECMEANRAQLEASEDALTSSSLLDRNPQVLAMAAEYEAAEESLRLEIRKQYPDLKIGPAYGGEDGQDRLGAGFSLPLPILNANKRAIAEAEAARQAARAAWEEAVLRTASDWENAQLSLASAKSRRDQIEKQMLPLAEKQMVLARKMAELGEFNALLLLESINAAREASLEWIEAGADLFRARARLLALAPSAASPSLEDEREAQCDSGAERAPESAIENAPGLDAQLPARARD